jgi:hypothetical protein
MWKAAKDILLTDNTEAHSQNARIHTPTRAVTPNTVWVAAANLTFTTKYIIYNNIYMLMNADKAIQLKLYVTAI